jgi:glyoxylase-like metal-dependent hydrolase (beta-lactamase superfamily II)
MLARVTMSVEPRPADLPLPGGREGATVRLHPLLTGEVRAPPGLIARPAGRLATLRGLGLGRSRRGWLWLPVPAFLVEHPGAGALLVDTGLHPSAALDPAQTLGRATTLATEVRMEAEQAVSAQLRARGLDHADVRVVVMTHLHYDHASAVSEFPDATFVVDRREWDSAIGSRGLLRGYRRQQFDCAFDWRAIDYDAPDVDSFASFGRSVDLFGDGSVRLLATPGHTLGHQSVLLRLREREALLCGDAAYTRRAIEHDVTPLFMHDEHRFFRSLHELRRFAERTPELLLIPGHDADVWPTLDAVYE